MINEKIYKDIRECKKAIMLVGLMGVGKTSIGKLLAKKLKIKFIDSDTEIEQSSLCSIVELFSIYGEEEFRQMEEKVIKRIINSTEDTFILSTGEGGFLSEGVRSYVKDKAITIWINTPFELLIQRAKFKSTRPLLLDKDPKDIIEKLMKERKHIYEESDIHIVPRNESIYKTVDKLIIQIHKFIKSHK